MSYLPSNRALLERYRAGDVQALEQIYAHYAPGLARTLRGGFAVEGVGGGRKFGGYGLPLELVDALQEVFTRAFSEQSRLGYDGLSPFAGYLAGIAHNVVIDDFRRRATAAHAVGAAAEASEPEPATSPETAAEEAEAQRLLASFASGLGGADRQLYQARFTDHLTQEEAARALGLTRIQVRRAELKLRRALLDHLKRNGYLEEAQMTGWGLQPPSRRRHGP